MEFEQAFCRQMLSRRAGVELAVHIRLAHSKTLAGESENVLHRLWRYEEHNVCRALMNL